MIEKQINGRNTKNMRSLVSQVWATDKLKKTSFSLVGCLLQSSTLIQFGPLPSCPKKNNQTEIISPTAMIIFMQIWFYVYIYIFSVILHYLLQYKLIDNSRRSSPVGT